MGPSTATRKSRWKQQQARRKDDLARPVGSLNVSRDPGGILRSLARPRCHTWRCLKHRLKLVVSWAVRQEEKLREGNQLK